MLQRLIPIRLEQVTYRIGAKPLVEDLSFEVGPAETVVLLGRGGSGKTTTLRLINGWGSAASKLRLSHFSFPFFFVNPADIRRKGGSHAHPKIASASTRKRRPARKQPRRLLLRGRPRIPRTAA